MSSPISLVFRYTERDFVRAMRAHYATHLRLRLDVAIILVLVIAGLYLWHSGESPSYGLALVGIAMLFALMLIAAFGLIPRIVFRREPKYRDEYSLTFSQEGIHFRTVHIDSQLGWQIYSSALIDSSSYVLYYGSRSFSVIPKRVFQSFEQQKEFEGLLERKISKITRKGL